MRLLRQPASRVVLASLVTQASLVISGPLVVRAIGVEGRGELAFAYAVILCASLIMPLGLPQAIAFHLASRRAGVAALLHTVRGRYVLLMVSGALLGAGFLVGVHLIDQESPTRISIVLLVALGIVAVMLSVLWMAVLQGLGRFSLLALTQVIVGPTYAVGVVLVWLLDVGTVPRLLAINVAAWSVVAVLGRALIRPHLSHPRLESALPELTSYGWRAWIAGAAPIDSLGFDQLIVALVLSHYALGEYAIGLAFESGPVLVLLALATIALQRVSATKEPAAQEAMIRRILGSSAVIAVLTIVAIQLVLEPLLLFAFGDEASSAVGVARILVVAGGFLGFRRVLASVLQGLGRPGRTTIGELAGFATMVVAMLVLPSHLGVNGAGWALAAAGAVATIVQLATLIRVWPRAAALPA